jgi:hypothetical protein
MSGNLPTVLTLTLSDFRAAFSMFKNELTYPDGVIEMFFGNATNYISDLNVGVLNNASRQLALYQMTAHLLILNNMLNENDGAPVGLTQDAQVDKVRVSLTPPPHRSQFGTWLNLTGPGAALWALLAQKAVGGFYAAGNPERLGFRRVGGGFGPGCRW